MSKRKKSNLNLPSAESSSFENSSLQTSVELDIRALRAKNAKLVQAVAKLQMEKAELQSQNTRLQEDYFKLNSSFVNLKSILSTTDGVVKTLIPRFVEMSELFKKMPQLCSIGQAVSANRDLRTQAVQPHTVNGHVLQHPTISLSRLNNNTSNVQTSRRRSNQNSANDEDSRQRSETVGRRTQNQNGTSEESTERLINNESNGQNEYEVERIYYRRRNIPLEPPNMDELQDQEHEEIDGEDDFNNDEEYCSRLFTIREEDENNFNSAISPRSRLISRDVRIYIDRLPSDYVRRNVPRIRNSTNNSITDNTTVYSSADSPRRESASCSRYSGTIANGSDNHSSCAENKSRHSDTRKRPSGGGVSCINDINDSQLLDGSGTSKATVIHETLYRRTTSPFKRREARYFGEPSSFLQSTSVQSLNSLQTNQNLEISDNISAIHNVPSCSVSHLEDDIFPREHECGDTVCTKRVLLDTLGLEPMESKFTTSTPLATRRSMTANNKSASSTTQESRTPIQKNAMLVTRVELTNGKSETKNKIAQVVLKRMTFEKRLSGSPRKKVSGILKAPATARSSQFAKRKKPSFKKLSSSSSSDSSGDRHKVTNSAEELSISNVTVKLVRRKAVKLMSTSDASTSRSSSGSDDSEIKENVDTSNRNSNLRITNKDNAETTGKTTANGSKKKINGRVLSKVTKRYIPQSSPKKFKMSPRPTRAARPTTLKEPTLNKKMRRSK